MKLRGFCLLLALVLTIAPAIAQEAPTGAPTASAPAAAAQPTAEPSVELSPTPEPSPEPSPTPQSVIFERDGLRLVLPPGFEILEEDALEGFEAALRADYPDAARTILAAVDATRDAAVAVAAVDSDADSLEAARDASDALIGDATAATEQRYGENRFASFACAIGDRPYYLYYLSDGARLLLIGATGLEAPELEALLTNLDAHWGESPAEALPTETPPTEALPTETLPAETLSSKALPTETPAPEATPTNAPAGTSAPSHPTPTAQSPTVASEEVSQP